jgi:hypothetical protein
MAFAKRAVASHQDLLDGIIKELGGIIGWLDNNYIPPDKPLNTASLDVSIIDLQKALKDYGFYMDKDPLLKAAVFDLVKELDGFVVRIKQNYFPNAKSAKAYLKTITRSLMHAMTQNADQYKMQIGALERRVA